MRRSGRCRARWSCPASSRAIWRAGDATNLGRGGSDYTAAILASTLDAAMLEIWTDVDGFMTADPKVINNAYVIERLSYVEAMELCNFGAKVIYPPTIFPAYHRNIPIVIKNTFNLDSPGTFISREHVKDPSRAIKGISSINDTCLITIQGLGMVGVIGVNYRIFKTAGQVGHQRVLRLAGGFREYDVDRRPQRRRYGGGRGALGRVRSGNRHGRDQPDQARAQFGHDRDRGREHEEYARASRDGFSVRWGATASM